MNCTDLDARLTEWLGGSLSERDARALEAHAASCDDCGARLEQLSRPVSLAATITPPPALRASVLTAVRQRRLSRIWRRGLVTASAVAAVALLAIALQPHRKEASDAPRGASMRMASERVKPELAALAAAEQELVAALAGTPDDAALQRALEDLRRQRVALERIVQQVAS
ncbi:MAG: zf-HC2 domain-containing protein [Gemmatimonadota bacterium]